MIILPDGVTDPEQPRLAWRNLVTAENMVANSAAAGFPIVNAANPTTFQLWRAAGVGAVEIDIDFGSATPINYLAIARHNFGSAGISYGMSGNGPGAEAYLPIAPTLPADDGVIIHAFDTLDMVNVTIALGVGSEAAQAAVIYVGMLTTLQRRIYVGHTPITYGRQTTVSTGMSEGGQFLGRVIRRQQFQTSIAQPNLDPDWYRENLAPFDEVAAVQPFFWAWRPDPYPQEVGYCWATQDTEFSNQRSNGMVQWGMNGVQGILR